MPHVEGRALTDIFDETLGATRRDLGRFLVLALLVWPVTTATLGIAIELGADAFTRPTTEVWLLLAFLVAWVGQYAALTMLQLCVAIHYEEETLPLSGLATQTIRRLTDAFVANAPGYGAGGAAVLAVAAYARVMLAIIESPPSGAMWIALGGGLVMLAVLAGALAVILRNTTAVVHVGRFGLSGRAAWRASAKTVRGRRGQALVLLAAPLAVTLFAGAVESAIIPSGLQSLGTGPWTWIALLLRQGTAALVAVPASVAWCVWVSTP
ncbi:MAG: hypothetical protein RIT81_29925 [Deltaproteobacteria bacterium]